MDLASALSRTRVEARYAATLLHARGAGVALTPPHRLVGLARAVEAYGPAGAAVAVAAATQPGSVAIRDECGAITFGELDALTNRFANALRGRGLRAGDGVGILARNHRGFFVAVLAAAKLGARTLLLNTDFAGPQLADVCSREDVCVLVHDAEFAEIVATIRPRLGAILADPDNSVGPGDCIASVSATGSAQPPPRPGRRQRVVLLTSGTTGTPKGAPRDLALSLVIPGGYLSKIPLRSGRNVLLAAPVFHAWGLLSAMLALGLGNSLIMTRRFEPEGTLTALAEHRCDALITVPILLSRLLDSGPDTIGRHDLSALRIIAVSGSALSPAVARRAMESFGDILYNVYGSTEVAYATIATPAELRAAPGTVGRPPYGTTVRVVDRDGRPVAPGQTGRVFVGNSIQFTGYTGGGGKQVLDGLMATGDLGHLDDVGRLFVEGRDDDMIVSGGENVFPAEVEELLSTHPGVREAAVVGVPDPDFGARLRAYVVRNDTDLDEEALRDLVRANLARYKVPRDIVFVSELPRNPAGKVVKHRLPDLT